MDAKLIEFLKEGTPIRFRPHDGEWANAVVIKVRRSKLILYTQNTNNYSHNANFPPGTIISGHELNDNCWAPEIDDEFELMENVQLKNY